VLPPSPLVALSPPPPPSLSALSLSALSLRPLSPPPRLPPPSLSASSALSLPPLRPPAASLSPPSPPSVDPPAATHQVPRRLSPATHHLTHLHHHYETRRLLCPALATHHHLALGASASALCAPARLVAPLSRWLRARHRSLAHLYATRSHVIRRHTSHYDTSQARMVTAHASQPNRIVACSLVSGLSLLLSRASFLCRNAFLFFFCRRACMGLLWAARRGPSSFLSTGHTRDTRTRASVHRSPMISHDSARARPRRLVSSVIRHAFNAPTRRIASTARLVTA
jgi:hypothetical protein